MNKQTLLLRIVSLLIIGVTLVYGETRLMEPRILFHPDRSVAIIPSMYDLPYREVVIPSGRYHLSGWYCDNGADRHAIYYHGNGGDMADRMNIVKIARLLRINLLLIDYRGYGRSEGNPTIEGFIEDAHAAPRWLFSSTGATPGRTFFWGHSLGSAAAITAASRYPDLGGVVVESGFVSLRSLSLRLYPYVPVAFVTNAFRNGAILSHLSAPKLIIHGLKDRVIPSEVGESLYRMAAKPKELLLIPTAGHNDTAVQGGERYLHRLSRWLYRIGLRPMEQGRAPQ